MARTDNEVVSLRNVWVMRDGSVLLRDVSWSVEAHQRWVVLGPNGAGKTTLLQVVSTYLSPTRGELRVLGRVRGRYDVRRLRPHIGYAGTGPSSLVHQDFDALEIVITGKHAAFVDSRWHPYEDTDWDAARSNLERLGALHLARRRYGTLSAGEKQRVMIARSLMTKPSLLLLDEATTGLDLGARERLVSTLGNFARDPSSPAVALVTHHVEEIPPGFGHIVLLNRGSVVAAGPIDTTLTAEALSSTFGVGLRLERTDGRFRAWSPAAP